MDEKLREQIIVALEKAMKAVGAKDYESGMEQTSRLAAAVYESAESMKTVDDCEYCSINCRRSQNGRK